MKPIKNKKAQISLEFLIVTTLVLLLLVIMGIVIYQKYAEWAALKLHVTGRNIANNLADGINQIIIVGEGYSQHVNLRTRYAGDEFNLTFKKNDPLIFVERPEMTWYAPTLTTEIYCCLSSCERFENETHMYMNSSANIKITYYQDTIYVGGLCDPVASWDLEEGVGSTAEDNSGNGNDGTIYGAQWIAGNYGHALAFSGMNNYVDCGSDPTLNPAQSLWTQELWFNTTNPAEQVMLSKRDGTDDFIELSMNSTEVRLQYDAGGGAVTVKAPGAYAEGNWHHVVGLRTGVKTAAIYLDGVPFESSASAGSPVSIDTQAAKQYIGRKETGSYYAGLIGEVRIYNRPLSKDEIAEHYRSGLIKYSAT
ncbi:MAG: LamG domain-containing protein [Candidatus Altiarchaeota archaeon]|nr:LamG domain-containing protein [Candidatus Altiarchaeota archaeon]